MQAEQVEQLLGFLEELAKFEGLPLGRQQGAIEQGHASHQMHHHLQQEQQAVGNPLDRPGASLSQLERYG